MKIIQYRSAHKRIQHLLQYYPLLQIFGATDVGKTAFVKRYFSDYQYVSLKNTQAKSLLLSDPFRFFTLYGAKTIIDDAEQVPDICSLVLQYSVSIYQSGSYLILTTVKPRTVDSNQVASLELLPLSIGELKQEQQFSFELEETILQGAYPLKRAVFKSKVHQQKLKQNFNLFVTAQNEHLPLKLLQKCSNYIDQTVNVNQLAKELGVTQPTVNAWLNYFEQLGILYFLKAYPHHFQKRTIKHAKLYFMDTGFACHLLGLKDKKDLLLSAQFKALTHNLYLLELLKKNALEPKKKEFFYWRESNGHEIHLLIQHPTSVDLYQFTSSHEFQPKLQKELDFFDEISDGIVLSKNIVYSGFKNQTAKNANLLSWQLIN